ncbi:DUF6801 domain-containing protein [Streptomyces sp. NPDC102467]|uniref:DUF6801 domain-containing protein n=1 Tax=Streptomyces sp. NPDC102467 TaxID=3366179 RepID=UPI003822BEC5
MKLALGVATAALAAVAGALGTGVAAAQPVSLTLNYTCDFPIINGQRVTVRINANVPNSHTVGAPTRPFPITVMATVGGQFTSGLHFLGVRSIEGTAGGNVNVAAPQGNFSVSIPFTIPNTTVPASGSFHVPVTGSAPSLRFTRTGNGRITAGNIKLHLAARDADGNPTLGRLDLPCTLEGGQNDVIESFDVGPKPTATRTGTSRAPSTDTTKPPATTTSGRATPGAGGGGAKGGSATTNGPGSAASGDTGTSTAGTSTADSSTAGSSAAGGSTTAKPTTTSAADGASLHATGGGAGNSRVPMLLTLGGGVAAIGAVGFGGTLWRRRHAGGEGFLTVSQVEQVEQMPEQGQGDQAGMD